MSVERIAILKEEIWRRQVELDNLTSRMMKEETDVRKRFVMWANNGVKKKQLSYLPSGAIRKWIDDHDWLDGSRGVINLLDIEEYFLIFSLTDDKLAEYNCLDEVESLKEDPVFIAACEHMMRDNVDSFAIDW